MHQQVDGVGLAEVLGHQQEAVDDPLLDRGEEGEERVHRARKVHRLGRRQRRRAAGVAALGRRRRRPHRREHRLALEVVGVGQRDDLRLHRDEGVGDAERGVREVLLQLGQRPLEVERVAGEREEAARLDVVRDRVGFGVRRQAELPLPLGREEVADEEVEPRVLHHQVEVAAEHQRVELEREADDLLRHLAEQPQRLAAELGELAEELVERRPLLYDGGAVADEQVKPLLLLLQRVLRELFRERLCHLGRCEERSLRIVDELQLAAVLVRADEQVVRDLVQDDEALRCAHHIVQDAARSLSAICAYDIARRAA